MRPTPAIAYNRQELSIFLYANSSTKAMQSNASFCKIIGSIFNSRAASSVGDNVCNEPAYKQDRVLPHTPTPELFISKKPGSSFVSDEGRGRPSDND